MAHVLVVDDEPLVRSIVSQFLKIGNHTTTQAECGEDALRELSASNIDIVLTDLSMPGMTGIEFLAAARQTHPDIPFIVMSGHFVSKSIEDRFDAALDKPLSLQDLLDAVSTLTAVRS
jgi:CheY-like chemotaxis protein